MDYDKGNKVLKKKITTL